MQPTEKSVITCDLEGRIETFSDGAERMFGYTRDEVIGKKRVSLFSPGEVVLEHVGHWLAMAVKHGAYSTRTVFLRKDGTPFSADFKVTPTFRKGVQIGYCGVTVARPDVPVEEAMPRISFATRIFRWLVVTRAPFLTAALVPVLVGAAYASRGPDPFAWGAFALALIGALALHVSANTFNDYFDWTSGTDQLNTEYFLPYSGGSRSIELGLITPAGLLRLAIAALLVGIACGGALLLRTGPSLLLYGLVGVFATIFYTAPPLRLAARKGLGELFVGLCFGPLMTAGTFTALTGQVDRDAFLIGIPVGLLITAVLWINEFPDAASDEAAGKRNLVVVLGKRSARWGYVALMLGALAAVLALVVAGLVPPLAALALLPLPLVVRAFKVLFEHYEDRQLVRANKDTILVHLTAGLLMAAGIGLADVAGKLIG